MNDAVVSPSLSRQNFRFRESAVRRSACVKIRCPLSAKWATMSGLAMA